MSMAALTGSIVGVFCAVSARHYDCLIRLGHDPDGSSMVAALRRALATPVVPIIWGDGTQWSDVVMLLTGAVAAVVLAGVYSAYGSSLKFMVISVACFMLLLLACIDVRVCLLPDALTQPLLWLGLVCAWAGMGISVSASLAGVMAGYAVLALPRLVWRRRFQQDAVGAGDVKLLAALGAWAGPVGVLYILTLACIAGVVFAVVHQRRWLPSGAYPFGPCLVLGGLAEFVSDSALQSWF